MKVDETSEIKEWTCTRSYTYYTSTNTGYSRLIIWISRLIHCIGQQIVGVLKFCQSNRLVFRPSRLLHGISRLIPWHSRLMEGLTVFFCICFQFKFDSGFLYSMVVIVNIDGVCLGI